MYLEKVKRPNRGSNNERYLRFIQNKILQVMLKRRSLEQCTRGSRVGPVYIYTMGPTFGEKICDDEQANKANRG